MELIQINPRDTVAVALCDLAAGAVCRAGGAEVRLLDDIPFGHKAALKDIAEGENIVKYGSAIGRAAKAIRAGEHVHVHNLKTNLSGTLEYAHASSPAPRPLEPAPTFDGYLRADGRAGTRNELWIVPTVGCVSATAAILAREAKARYGDVADGVAALAHNMGCSQMGEDQARTMEILAGLVANPNAGGVLVLSLGCENNNLDVFRPYLEKADPARLRFLVTQDAEDEIEAGMERIASLAEGMRKDRRQIVSAEKLTIGFKCGGSDAFSGITANALCGRITDRLTGFGGAAILTEVPEMFGAETFLMDRAEEDGVFQQIVGMVNGFKDYLVRHGQTLYENPSPGNKQGGISTLEEKSLGCIQKGGSATVAGVLNYGEPCAKRGLNLLAGPGNDQVSCTNLVASGANLIVFTTGRGNPYGAPVPTVKLASNSRLAQLKKHWIDYDAGGLLAGASFEETAADFFRYVLDVASGRIRTRNEVNGYKEISIFRDGVIL